PPRDPAAIDLLARTFRENKCEMKPVLRTLFTSDFFKNARYKHMKSPAEVVVGTLRQMGGYEIAMPGYGELSMQPSYMGQDLLNPPSVEGWHTGQEWINSGSLMAHQLRRRAGRQYIVARRAGDHQAAAGDGRAGAGGAGRFVPRFTRASGSRRRHQEGAGRAGEGMGPGPLGHGRERPRGHQTYRRTAATDRGDARVSIRVTQEL